MFKLKFVLLLVLILVGTMTISVQVSASNQIDQDQLVLHDSHETNSTDDGFEDSDNDGIDDEKEDAYERNIEVEYDEVDGIFRSKSVLKNDTNKDKFEVEFDVKSDNAAELSFEYTKAFEVNSISNETELSYDVKFDEIVEFNDIGLPGYQNETPVQTYEIGQVGDDGWKDLVVYYNSTTGYVEVNATTMDGVFTLVMKLSSSFLVDDNVILSPNSLKIDVIINNFNYTGTDTKLAVKSHIKTSSELSIETESEDELEGIASNETQVGISSANATGFFSWAEYAMMDGAKVDVISSSLEDSSDEEGEQSSKMYFTFNSTSQGDAIVWDPKLGVISEAVKSNLSMQDPSDTSDNVVVDTDAGSLRLSPWTLLFFLAIPVLRRQKKL